MLSYFKGQWPENPVPKGVPQWMFYEVVTARDVVTRTVEVFAGGSLIRDSIELSEREGADQRAPEYRSLVHGPFLELTREYLTPISASEFCILWDSATDN